MTKPLATRLPQQMFEDRRRVTRMEQDLILAFTRLKSDRTCQPVARIHTVGAPRSKSNPATRVELAEHDVVVLLPAIAPRHVHLCVGQVRAGDDEGVRRD